MRSLLFLSACCVAVATSQAIFESAVMGRYAWGDNGTIQFDFPGIVFSYQSMGGLTRLDVVLSVVHTNTTVPPVQRQGALKAPPAVGYEPHRFGAYLFAGYNSPLSRPPPLDQNFGLMNFTTVTWASNVETTITLFDDLDPDIAWSIFVIKMTEADWNQAYFAPNYVTLHRFEAHDAQRQVRHVLPFTRSSDVQPVGDTLRMSRRRRIEFLGDSITAGYCNLCENPNVFSSEDFALTWGYRIAEHFDADYHAEAWSGYGVIRNCNGGDVLMPEIFDRPLATVDLQDWNFSSWVPDIFVINLGTNDNPNPNTPNGTFEREFVKRFTALLNHTATQRYSEAVRDNADRSLSVYVACGPMQSAADCIFANETLANLAPEATSRTKFYFLNFAGALQPSETCCGHPSGKVGDVILANITIKRIMETEGWI